MNESPGRARGAKAILAGGVFGVLTPFAGGADLQGLFQPFFILAALPLLAASIAASFWGVRRRRAAGSNRKHSCDARADAAFLSEPTALVVDPNEASQREFAVSLLESGLRAVAVPTEEEAVALLRRSAFDCVICNPRLDAARLQNNLGAGGEILILAKPPRKEDLDRLRNGAGT